MCSMREVSHQNSQGIMIKIEGVVYKKLLNRGTTGLVEPDQDIIYADERLRGKELLDILLHEGTHILQRYLNEEAVDHIGVELSNMLWAQGWRRVDFYEPLQDEPPESAP